MNKEELIKEVNDKIITFHSTPNMVMLPLSAWEQVKAFITKAEIPNE